MSPLEPSSNYHHRVLSDYGLCPSMELLVHIFELSCNSISMFFVIELKIFNCEGRSCFFLWCLALSLRSQALALGEPLINLTGTLTPPCWSLLFLTLPLLCAWWCFNCLQEWITECTVYIYMQKKLVAIEKYLFHAGKPCSRTSVGQDTTTRGLENKNILEKL